MKKNLTSLFPRFAVFLLLFISLSSHATDCKSQFASYAQAEEEAAAQAMLKKLHFDGYMRDFIGWFYTHEDVKKLGGRQKALLWKEAVREVQKKQSSYQSRELVIEEGEIKATAFVGSIPSRDFKSTIVFFEKPNNGEFAFLHSTEEMVSLAQRGADPQGRVTKLGAEEMQKLKDAILKASSKK